MREQAIFEPYSDNLRAKCMMIAARKVNASRDSMDREAGFGAPNDGHFDGWLRNAISAIAAGLVGKDWTCVCEGLDMLQQAELHFRKQRLQMKKPAG